MQNGVGVEGPFLDAQFPQVHRCVLLDLQNVVRKLATKGLPFHPETNIQREIWEKAIVRNKEEARLANEVIMECIALTDRLDLLLTPSELMEQIMLTSKRFDGQLLSTLQDIRCGRETEIEFLNLEMTRVAASQRPRIDLPRTDLLGKMILAKSMQRRTHG